MVSRASIRVPGAQLPAAAFASVRIASRLYDAHC